MAKIAYKKSLMDTNITILALQKKKMYIYLLLRDDFRIGLVISS